MEEGDIDDLEINRLENIRRFGHPENRTGYEECEYFALPPKRYYLMKDWTEWRVKLNNLLSEEASKIDGHVHQPENTLTSSLDKKTPAFFRGKMSIHGQRVKDEYGGNVITETDDAETRIEKKIIDENFYLFGIPRISRRRSLGGSHETPDMTERLRKTSDTFVKDIESVSKLRRGSTGTIDVPVKLISGSRRKSYTGLSESTSSRSGSRSSIHDIPITEGELLDTTTLSSRTGSRSSNPEDELERSPGIRRGSFHSDNRLKLKDVQHISISENDEVVFEEETKRPQKLILSSEDPRCNFPPNIQSVNRRASTGNIQRRLRRTPIDSV